MEKNVSGSRLSADFSRGETWSLLNRLFTAKGSRGRLKKNHYHTFNMVLPFGAGLINRANIVVEQVPMTRFHTIYSVLLIPKTGYTSGERTDEVRNSEQRGHTKGFKRILKSNIYQNCETVLQTLRFHMLYDVTDNEEQFGCLVWDEKKTSLSRLQNDLVWVAMVLTNSVISFHLMALFRNCTLGSFVCLFRVVACTRELSSTDAFRCVL